MKRIIIFILIAFIFTNCKKDKNNNHAAILIKGKISGLKSSNSLADAKKILVIEVLHGILVSRFVDIKDGAFTDTTNMGLATALVFLDQNNKYIGTFANRGLNLLPLGNLLNGESTVIDLSTLTLSGTTIIPTHDPFGNEIIISDKEIASLKDLSGFFETLSKNIDADNDGTLDAMSNKQLFIKSRFSVTGGHWGLNNTPPVLSDSATRAMGYTLEVDGDKGFSTPHSLVFTGPADSPYNNLQTQFINPNGNGGFYSQILKQEAHNLSSFKRGVYTITIDGKPYTMNYSNVDAYRNLVLVVPTLQTNSEGKLVSISLQYKSPANVTIEPGNILTDVMVQLNDNNLLQFYTTPRLLNTYAKTDNCDCVNGLYTYTLKTPLDISKLSTMTIVYQDLLGNNYFINWSK